jgi:hypothetical protein
VAKEAGTIKCGFYLSVAVSRTNQPFSSSSARGNNFGAGKIMCGFYKSSVAVSATN